MGQGYDIGCSNCFSNGIRPSDNLKGTYFHILIGAGMLCFCKEQFEKYYGIYRKCDREYKLLAAGDPPDELYSKLDSPVKDDKINAEIYENIKNGYEFTDDIGYLPCYCDFCKSLHSKFQFYMIKEKNIYIPKYQCNECNNVLEPIRPTHINDHDFLKKLGITLKLTIDYKKNGLVKIKSRNIEKKLICKYCNNETFSCLGFASFWD
jgi:hypothetical protein